MKALDQYVLRTLSHWTNLQQHQRPQQPLFNWSHDYEYNAHLASPSFSKDDRERYPASPTQFRMALHGLLAEQGYEVPTLHTEMCTRYYKELRPSYRYYSYSDREYLGEKTTTLPLTDSTLLNSLTESVTLSFKTPYNGHSAYAEAQYSPVIYPDKAFLTSTARKKAQIQIYQPSEYEERTGKYPYTMMKIWTTDAKNINFGDMLITHLTSLAEQVTEQDTGYKKALFGEMKHLLETVENTEVRKTVFRAMKPLFEAEFKKGDLPFAKEVLDCMLLHYSPSLAATIDFPTMRQQYLQTMVEISASTLDIAKSAKGNFTKKILKKGNKLLFDDQVRLAETQISILNKVQPFFRDFYQRLTDVHQQASEAHTNEGIPAQTVTNTFTISVNGLGDADAYALYTNLVDAQKATGIEGIDFDYDHSRKEITCNITNVPLNRLAPKGELQEAFYSRIIENTNRRGHFASKILRDTPAHLKKFFHSFYEQLQEVYDYATENLHATVTAEFEVNVKSLSPAVAYDVVEKLNAAQAGTSIRNIIFEYKEDTKEILCKFNKVPVADIEPRGHLKDAMVDILQDRKPNACFVQ